MNTIGENAHRALNALAATVIACVAGSWLAVGCGGASDGPEVWRLAIEETEGSVQDAFAREFERRIEEATNDAVDVKVYPYGSLGKSDDITEQARMGSLQFAMASPGHLGKTIPEIQALLLHFVFTDDDATNRAALDDPELRAALDPLFPEKDLELLALLPEGWMVWTTNESVRSPSDFEGIKIRTMTSPLLLETYRAYGASPQAMPYGEVYSALQLNMIDAQVNPVFAIEEMSFFEVTDHMTFPRAAPFTTTFVANAAFMGAIGEERAALVRGTVAELGPWLDAHQAEVNAARLDRILAEKPAMQVVRLSDEERAAFRALSLPVRESFVAATGERGTRVLDALLGAVERARQE